MNRTNIEWVKNPDGTQGYTWNPITGCLNGCEYCYARKLANGRLKPLYLANDNIPNPSMAIQYLDDLPPAHKADPFYPRFWPERIDKARLELINAKPRGIFVCDMGELFGDWVPRAWQDKIFEVIEDCPQHRFYLLTKQPQNLIKFSPYPPNCWVGVTATDTRMALEACLKLGDIEASIRYVSIEPMLNSINLPPELLKVCKIDWVIIGACTGTKEELLALVDKLEAGKQKSQFTLMPYGNKWTLQPAIDWVEAIVRACGKAGVPVFQKDNLKPLLGNNLRQELKNKTREPYHIYGNPWGGYAECFLCGRKSRWYTSCPESGHWYSGLGFWFGFPMANIDGFIHHIIHHKLREGSRGIKQRSKGEH